MTENRDIEDRVLQLEVERDADKREVKTWRDSVERRLTECSTGMRWFLGLMGTALVGIVTALLTRGP